MLSGVHSPTLVDSEELEVLESNMDIFEDMTIRNYNSTKT